MSRMSNYATPVSYGIATLLRECGYRGKDMTYGAALDWLAAQKGVLLWIEFRWPRYYFARALLPGKRIAHYITDWHSWTAAADVGIEWVLNEIRK